MTDKNGNIRRQKYVLNLSVFLLLLSVVLACNLNLGKDESNRSSPQPQAVEEKSDAPNGNRKSSKVKTNQTLDAPGNPRVEICKRYESCDCQTYESCLTDLENDSTPDEPGILECILASSCESLCAGKPDGCPNRKSEAPQRSNCSQIRCSKDSDCPGDCHGGCSEGVCYMF